MEHSVASGALSDRDEWERILVRQEESGLSIGKFCRAEGLKEHRFYIWKKRLRGGGKQTATRAPRRNAEFVELSSSLERASESVERDGWAVELVLSSGTVVRVRG